MLSNGSNSNSLKSSSSLLSDQDKEALQDLAGHRGFQLYLEEIRKHLLGPAEDRLRGSKEVPDMCRAQGSVEALEKCLKLLHHTLRSSQGGKPV